MEIKINGKVVKLNKSVQLYLKIIDAPITSFNKEFADPYDGEKYIVGYRNECTDEVLGISMDGESYAWFDNEHYNL